MQNEETEVIKKSGEKVRFSKEKLQNSLLRSGADALDTLSFRLFVLALCRALAAGDRASIEVGLDWRECVFEVADHQRRLDFTAAVELPAIGQKHLAWGLSQRPSGAQVDLAIGFEPMCVGSR
jgi:hypothetical protein